MAEFNSGAVSDVLHGLTYEGVWEKYNAPLTHRWIWTLSTLNAVVVLACFTVLLAFTESRTWALTRHIVRLRHKAVRLDDDTRLDPLEYLSQEKAMADILPMITRYFSKMIKFIYCRRGKLANAAVQRDCTVISPWFGVLATINILLFGTLGIAMPYLLSEGVLDAAVVKSKSTSQCLKPQLANGSIAFLEDFELFRSRRSKTDAIYDICVNLTVGCGSQYFLQQPQIKKARTDDCPFPNNICRNDTQPFQLTHSNITAFELGANFRSYLTLNHRLTCAPVHLDSFLTFEKESPGNFSDVSLAVTNKTDCNDDHFEPRCAEGLHLQSINGPNSFSLESSGSKLNLARNEKSTSLRIHPATKSWNEPWEPNMIHPNLRTKDGKAFLIIQLPGTAISMSEIDDPFFAAHNKRTYDFGWGRNLPTYIPDYEATALGCLEQFQLCDSNSNICTPWGQLTKQNLTSSRWLLEVKDNESIEELRLLLAMMPSALSVFQYMSERVFSTLPFTSGQPWMTNNPWIVPPNSKDQWITEVETWFRKSAVNAILFTQNGARIALGDADVDSDDHSNQSLCGRILFRDPYSTNINWIGFWACTSLFIVLCIASYIIEWIAKTVARAWKLIRKMYNTLWKKLVLVGMWLRHPRVNVQMTGGRTNSEHHLGERPSIFRTRRQSLKAIERPARWPTAEEINLQGIVLNYWA